MVEYLRVFGHVGFFCSWPDKMLTITAVEVREATTEVETTTGTVVQVFTTGTMVQVFLLAKGVPADSWSGSGSRVPS